MCQATETLVVSITPETIKRMEDRYDILELLDQYDPGHNLNQASLPDLQHHLLQLHDEAASQYQQTA